MGYGKFLKFLKDEKCAHEWVLDPYSKGCAGGCSYCYAKAIHEGHGSWNEEPSAAKMKQIRYQLRHHFKAGDVIRIGSMADPLQPIEEQERLTEMTVEDCVRLGIHHLIVTKFARVASDDMLAVYDKRLSHFQITLTSTDEDFAEAYERGASSVSERIAAIERLQRLGYDVSIRLSPFVVDFVDNGMLDIQILNAVECDKILIEFLRVNGRIRNLFCEHSDMRRYTEKRGVFWHLPLDVKKAYVERLLETNPQNRQVTFAEVVPEHHAYWREHYNANKSDCCNLRWKIFVN